MERKLRARLDSLPKTGASFIEPMECLSVSKLPGGDHGFGRSYVTHHITSLWRPALCGAGNAGRLGRRTRTAPEATQFLSEAVILLASRIY
jgi:hypothetical protein